MHHNKNREEEKVCIFLLTCGLTRAIHLKLLSHQTADEFKRALKRLIARRGSPEKVYSDNAKTYVAAS